jgi:hypothetical protein
MKKISIIIVFLLIILTFLSVFNKPLVNADLINYETDNVNNNRNSQSNLVIKDFSTKINEIIITLENVGDQEISDVVINIEVNGGLFIKSINKQLKIANISAGNEISKTFSIIGLGFGIILDYPKFTFTISSPDIKTLVGTVTTKIYGPFIKIICKSYDDEILSKGYTLIAPMWDYKAYLIDNWGDIVHSWKSIHLESQAAYLLENGNLIRTSIVPFSNIFSGGAQGFIEMFDWNGSRIWNFKYSNKEYCQHHDLEVLPNGNILLIAWEVKTSEEAISKGKNPDDIYRDEIWTDHIIEIEPVGDSEGRIVWEWHAWDHLIQDYDPSKENYGEIKDHPELIDINFGNDWRDWLHTNSIDYNEELDQILLSVFNFNEIWVIDHSTTTEGAAGHTGGKYGKGGDLLYRWGNPIAYDHGNLSNQQLFGQHGSYWIEEDYAGEGNILIFNNRGGDLQERASSVLEIIPPVNESGEYLYNEDSAYEPKKPIWEFKTKNPKDMFSYICSNAQRLTNGNTLICSATQATLYEVNYEKEIVWMYYNKFPNWYVVKTIPEAIRYSPDYPGLKNLFVSES